MDSRATGRGSHWQNMKYSEFNMRVGLQQSKTHKIYFKKMCHLQRITGKELSLKQSKLF